MQLVILAFILAPAAYVRAQLLFPVPPADALFKDPTQPIDVRVSHLLSLMTLDEKVAQLTYLGGVDKENAASAVKNGGVGGLQCSSDAATCVSKINALQAILKNSTRLGIPVSVFAETTHTGGSPNSTVFPMPVTLGAAWNTTLMEVGLLHCLPHSLCPPHWCHTDNWCY